MGIRELAAISNCLFCDSYFLLTVDLIDPQDFRRSKGKNKQLDLHEQVSIRISSVPFLYAPCPTCQQYASGKSWKDWQTSDEAAVLSPCQYVRFDPDEEDVPLYLGDPHSKTGKLKWKLVHGLAPPGLSVDTRGNRIYKRSLKEFFDDTIYESPDHMTPEDYKERFEIFYKIMHRIRYSSEEEKRIMESKVRLPPRQQLAENHNPQSEPIHDTTQEEHDNKLQDNDDNSINQVSPMDIGPKIEVEVQNDPSKWDPHQAERKAEERLQNKLFAIVELMSQYKPVYENFDMVMNEIDNKYAEEDDSYSEFLSQLDIATLEEKRKRKKKKKKKKKKPNDSESTEISEASLMQVEDIPDQPDQLSFATDDYSSLMLDDDLKKNYNPVAPVFDKRGRERKRRRNNPRGVR